MTDNTILSLDLPDIKKRASGKVREIFDVDADKLLIVATDRISAFDVIMPNGIPHKGRVLTQISSFWFDKTKHIIANHIIATDAEKFPPSLLSHLPSLQGRSMLCRKTQPLAIECVVRGYLAGSGWKEYKQSGTVCGIKLPAGLVESSELPEPIFTPATKAVTGHDENISFEEAVKIVGKDIAEKARAASIAIYKWARDYARQRGVIIADTKFEFGQLPSGDLIIIDEMLTPDSSRFWPADQYKAGRSQASFDKQFLRDYLETLDWNKTPPGPQLPADIIAKTSEKYLDAYKRITGHELKI